MSTSKFKATAFGLVLSGSLLIPTGLAYAAPTPEPTQATKPATSAPSAAKSVAPKPSAAPTTAAGTTQPSATASPTADTRAQQPVQNKAATAAPSASASTTAPAPTPVETREANVPTTTAIAKAAEITNVTYANLSEALGRANKAADDGRQYGEIVGVTREGCVLVVTAVTGAPGTYRIELWDDGAVIGYTELATTGPGIMTYRHLITRPFGTLSPGIDVALSVDGTELDAQMLWDDPASAAAASYLFNTCARSGGKCSGTPEWNEKICKSIEKAKKSLASRTTALPSTGN